VAITRNEDMPGNFGGPAVVPQHDPEWSEARRTAMDRMERIAGRVVAARGGLSLSCKPEWKFGTLYFTHDGPAFDGDIVEILEYAVELGKHALGEAKKGLSRRYPTQGLRFDDRIRVNTLDRKSLVLSLYFDKAEGVEILLG
jgi:hypothetical protein